MELHTLKPAPGAKKDRKRIGRGPGSGKGGTATRGTKGAQSRSGYKSKRGFEGGQLPLQKRIPISQGFKNINRVVYKPINLGALQQLAEKIQVDVMDATVLSKHGLINKHDRYKILGDGLLRTKLNISAHAFSASAYEAIKKLGGQAALINVHA